MRDLQQAPAAGSVAEPVEPEVCIAHDAMASAGELNWTRTKGTSRGIP